jgi:hypothetical protein
VKVLPWREYDSKALEIELHQICQGLQRILGNGMRIETELCDSMQNEKSGKFRWIISEVSKDILEKGM